MSMSMFMSISMSISMFYPHPYPYPYLYLYLYFYPYPYLYLYLCLCLCLCLCLYFYFYLYLDPYLYLCLNMRVHSSVVRAADCRSAGPWFKSGCALFLLGRNFRSVPWQFLLQSCVSRRVRHKPNAPQMRSEHSSSAPPCSPSASVRMIAHA